MAAISVALCTFNGARFIGQQLQSILDQTRAPEEIVISDDGSTDATLDVVRSVFTAAKKREITLRILESTNNLGVTANFERAVNACNGPLIALSDQDDIWHPDRLADAITAFDDPALMLQHTNARLVDTHGEPLGVSLFEALRLSSGERQLIVEGNAFDVYIRRNVATGATMLFRKSLLEYALPFPAEWVHDEWLAIIAAAVGDVQLIQESLIDYRQHDSNQIGVKKSTLKYRVGRMVQPRGDRYFKLAARALVLCKRLDIIPASPEVRQRAQDRARFDDVRSTLPSARYLRIGTVLREWRKGSYSRLSSQRGLDVLRDILQPAGERSQSVG